MRLNATRFFLYPLLIPQIPLAFVKLARYLHNSSNKLFDKTSGANDGLFLKFFIVGHPGQRSRLRSVHLLRTTI